MAQQRDRGRERERVKEERLLFMRKCKLTPHARIHTEDGLKCLQGACKLCYPDDHRTKTLSRVAGSHVLGEYRGFALRRMENGFPWFWGVQLAGKILAYPLTGTTAHYDDAD